MTLPPVPSMKNAYAPFGTVLATVIVTVLVELALPGTVALENEAVTPAGR